MNAQAFKMVSLFFPFAVKKKNSIAAQHLCLQIEYKKRKKKTILNV